MPHIAIVAMNAYPVINQNAGDDFGGLETFAWTLAKTLALESPMKISLLVRSTHEIPDTVVSQVHLIPLIDRLRNIQMHASRYIRQTPRFPWIRLHRWSFRLLWELPLLAIDRAINARIPHEDRVSNLLRDSGVDIILTLGVNADSMAAIIAAERLEIPCYLWIRSNGDIDRRFFSDPEYINPYQVSSQQCKYQTERATEILCQTDWQQKELLTLSHRKAHIIRNPVNLTDFSPGTANYNQRTPVLWIGRYDQHHKRPLLAVEVARRLPEIPFQLICNIGDPQVEDMVKELRPPNLQLINFVQHKEIASYYQTARLFLSTGSAAHEGFPNVFLEAAASGTPIVSLEDFDNFLALSHAGHSAASDINRLITLTQQLWHSEETWLACSQSAIQYVRNNHSPSRTAALLTTLLCRRNTNSLHP